MTSNVHACEQLPARAGSLCAPEPSDRPVGYWQRVAQIADAAPPLDDDQRARLRAALHTPAATAPAA